MMNDLFFTTLTAGFMLFCLRLGKFLEKASK